MYEQDSSKIFPNTNINGGIAITYRDASKNFGAIEVFSPYDELRSIQEKIQPFLKYGGITEIIISQNHFDLETLYKDYPECADIISSGGRERRIVSSAFEKLPVFKIEKEEENDIKILGIINAKRQYRWISSKYVEENDNLKKWKVFVPSANGASGTIGEQPARIISKPVLGEPYEGITQTFISIGAFESEFEAQAALKYVKMEFGGADHGLDRPDGTGGRRSRTGVAVQSRDAAPLQLSTRDLPLKEVQKEGVGGQRRAQLDLPAMSVLSQCPHTPCTD